MPQRSLHTVIRLQPLPHRNSLYACQVTTAYRHTSGEGIAPPYGAMADLVRDIRDGKCDVYQVAARIRTWRI